MVMLSKSQHNPFSTCSIINQQPLHPLQPPLKLSSASATVARSFIILPPENAAALILCSCDPLLWDYSNPVESPRESAGITPVIIVSTYNLWECPQRAINTSNHEMQLTFIANDNHSC